MSRRSTTSSSGSTACAPFKEDCTLSFTSRSRCAKQPLYRPAALRRNDAPSHISLRNKSNSSNKIKPASPPLTPSLSSTDLNRSWLSGLTAAAMSPLAGPDKDFRFDANAVRGNALSKDLWKPDEDAQECDDPDCSARFGLLERRHHCRRCGNIYCATHSSRTALLFGSPSDGGSEYSSALPTPRETPRTTPRGSMLDIPSLVSPSPSSSSFSYVSSSTTPTLSSPKVSSSVALHRVCDACYFSVPQLNTPPLHSQPFSFTTNPVALRRQNTSPLHSPGQSPPYESPLYSSASSSRDRRARKDSATSSSERSNHSSPPSSLDSSTNATVGGGGKSSIRGISPAASIRANAPRTVEEEDDERVEGEEDTVAKGPAPVVGSLAWTVNWATF